MEPIKQEIINNIFENGDKLITGPILQTVLIDMIDDVNVKDQEILSKTGSWDNAVTQIPNLATKGEVTNLSESIARDLENVDVDLTGYATEQWVESQGYLKEHQDISNLATKTELTAAENNLQGNITSLSESVARDLANVSVPEGVATEQWVQSQDYASKTYVDSAVSSSSVDLTGYATETWVQSQGYLKEHQDISGLATKTELNDTKNNLQGNITSLSESVARDLANVDVDLTGYATETWVQNQGYLKEHQDISGLATKTELTSVSESVKTDITNLSESVANSAVWKKDTGTDSIVQAIAGGTNLPTATGNRAIAIGQGTAASGEGSHAEGEHTKASGFNSHAEGFWTEAPGNNSHAEGGNTEASGQYSHAEGWYAFTTNDYEHAQGQYNHNSKNQIFSVGAGEVTPPDYRITRRNAVSILAVPNADTQVVTASFFVQNVGGYDGTNPIPGTNDLATVINNLPSGGGSSETLWKKGTGTDSVVQAIANGTDQPTATGERAVAIGDRTKASGQASHAEGYWTEASGGYSHAEGRENTAKGEFSHTEGFNTIASNNYEHAQGIRNYNSTNQIFSVGAGDYTGDYVEASNRRRNAISVLAVPNSDTQVVTASFFVQNVGGYDGTNPLPGTNDLATVINGMSTGGGSSETLWKKGEGKDSIVQILTGADEAKTPTATGTGSIATGLSTNASGNYSHAEGGNTKASSKGSHAEGFLSKASEWYSHAEGYSTTALGEYSHAEGESTKASGECSHAEGRNTVASGQYSHAEGSSTNASNDFEHAQGRYNYTSSNQIFSIGTGNSDTDRRNAVSVLEVSNNNSYTGSFFVQNVGGYDGTNPTPGTNDLATVLNNTETWTFTLEDGSTVTKNVRIS